MRTEFKVGLKKFSSRRISINRQKFKKEPLIKQYLILAHHIKITLENNPKMTLREIANCIGFTPARISQIMNLLYLAPFIQDDIILSDEPYIHKLIINKANLIAREFLWDKQNKMLAQISTRT